MSNGPVFENTGWGSKDGHAVHIDHVKRGLQCGCVCPNCGGALIARKGAKRIHHFAHATSVDCNRLGESALHLACKGIIAEMKKMRIPKVVASDGRADGSPCNDPQGNDFVSAPMLAKFNTVVLEQPLKHIIPDVTASMDSRKLCIEIKVTHAVDNSKAKKYERMDISALEIDASSLSRDASRETIKQHVIDLTENKKWIYNAKAAKVLSRCARKDASDKFVDCPLPTIALLDNLPENGWKRAAYWSAQRGKVHFLYNCLYCKHALCFSDEHLYCNATKENTKDYKSFPGGY